MVIVMVVAPSHGLCACVIMRPWSCVTVIARHGRLVSAASAGARRCDSMPAMPAMRKPRSGRKTIALYTPSALHHVDVFDRDRAAVAEEGDEDGEADRRLGGGDRQHDQA